MATLSYAQIHEQIQAIAKSIAIAFYRLVITSSRTKALIIERPPLFGVKIRKHFKSNRPHISPLVQTPALGKTSKSRANTNFSAIISYTMS